MIGLVALHSRTWPTDVESMIDSVDWEVPYMMHHSVMKPLAECFLFKQLSIWRD